ncbi:MAG: hypothetical protein GX465_13130, partial [Acidobacteria bacterium]|nr:hypothetical protein [Acidobacteriota bacterium]
MLGRVLPSAAGPPWAPPLAFAAAAWLFFARRSDRAAAVCLLAAVTAA